MKHDTFDPILHREYIRPLPKVPTYIGRCCREWVLAIGAKGRCGLCGEKPTYSRPDPNSPHHEATE
jgi:hypothetical protein